MIELRREEPGWLIEHRGSVATEDEWLRKEMREGKMVRRYALTVNRIK